MYAVSLVNNNVCSFLHCDPPSKLDGPIRSHKSDVNKRSGKISINFPDDVSCPVLRN